MSGVVVVGGGLAGLRSAEALRAAGYAGPLTVLGEEPHLPYSRPPLSKEALKEGVRVESLEFRRKSSVDDVDFRLDCAVIASDLDAGTVTLAGGAVLHFDGLVIATGIRPRRLPIPGPTAGRIALRTVGNAADLRERLGPGAHLVVMGAGFVGSEVAATARGLGAEVSVVALDEEPMVRPLGPDMGAALRRRHEKQGVHFHLGHTVDSFDGDEAVRSASLSDGTELPADVVVEAVGSVPNVDWLEGNGLDLSNGVLVDSAMRVVGTSAAVVAAGDIARYPISLGGPAPRRIEHWNMPTETGRRAGQTLAALLAGGDVDHEPFRAMPAFWSDQYDIALQSFGLPELATEVRVADGDLDGDAIVEYLDENGLVGVVGINRTRDLAPWRSQLMDRARQGMGT